MANASNASVRICGPIIRTPTFRRERVAGLSRLDRPAYASARTGRRAQRGFLHRDLRRAGRRCHCGVWHAQHQPGRDRWSVARSCARARSAKGGVRLRAVSWRDQHQHASSSNANRRCASAGSRSTWAAAPAICWSRNSPSSIAHFEHYPRERVIAVHAEHEPAVRFFAQRGMRRPPICAELETARAIALAEMTQRRLHICHVSTRREVELIAEAKARGVAITCEYAPHHLFLSTDPAGRPHNGLPDSVFEMNPPLRSPEDVALLWAASGCGRLHRHRSCAAHAGRKAIRAAADGHARA